MDLYTGLFFLAFTLIYISQIPAIRITRISPIDSAAYPKVLAALLLGLSLVQIFSALRQLKRGVPTTREEELKKGYKGVVQSLLLFSAYVLVVEPLGFLISSVLYIFLQILVLCPPDKVRPVQFGFIALAASGGIYVIFRYGLNLMLPVGILEGLI